MNVHGLLGFLDNLEHKGLLNQEANGQIRNFLTRRDASLGKLFLTMASLIGAIFASAGVFSIISYNWSDFPKHVRGVLSFVPSLIALFFYYKAVFKHTHSASWIEASSLFLMLMIGASVSLVSQTYQMDGDFDTFLKVWLFLTVPLFYFRKASGIAIVYLGLSLKFLWPDFSWGFLGPSTYEVNENYLWFWLFLILFLPHFFLSLDRKSLVQGFRSIYLGWLIVLVIFLALPFAVKSGYIWWVLTFIMGFYLLGKKYYPHNISALGRPFQTAALYHIFYILIAFSVDDYTYQLFRIDPLRMIKNWETDQLVFFFLALFLSASLTIIAWLWRRKSNVLNRAVVLFPVFYGFLFLSFCLHRYYEIDLSWWTYLIFNFYVISFGVIAMIQGNRSGSVLYMMYGLFLICALLWVRYFDMDISYWVKGILFIFVGLVFFLIHFISNEELKD